MILLIFPRICLFCSIGMDRKKRMINYAQMKLIIYIIMITKSDNKIAESKHKSKQEITGI